MAQAKEINISPELITEAVKRAMAALGQSSGRANVLPAGGGNSRLDGKRDYPLSSKRPELVKSASGLSLDDIRLEKVVSGEITFDDIKIRPETLEYQAQIAESMGRPHLRRQPAPGGRNDPNTRSAGAGDLQFPSPLPLYKKRTSRHR